jgi:carbamoyltransferase
MSDSSKIILGISAYYHDSAAALVSGGEIIAAAQEERFTRKKHDPSFPKHAIDYCLSEAGISLSECDAVVFYDKPFLKFERLLETYVACAPRGFRSFQQSMPLWIKEKLFLKSTLREELQAFDPNFDARQKLLFTEHHLSHAASAFYPSPFSEAAVLVMDGVGEWATTSFAVGKGNQLEILKEIHFPHSLGLLYSAFTYYTGFKVNSGEYKLMGLAPYGVPLYADLIRRHLIDVKEDGSFWLNSEYFDYMTGLRMTGPKFDQLFGAPARTPDQKLEQRHMDLAASVQVVVEEIIILLAQNIRQETGMKNLCLAGGVALNCVANGKLLREKIFERIWIQPASGDAGGALGAALAAHHGYFGGVRENISEVRDAMKGSYLGPDYSQEKIERALTDTGAVFEVLSYDEMIQKTARSIADQMAIGWFQGRMEFGPRALGGRSILGDPRSPKMQSVLNLKVKYRESFRPFAPAILCEEVSKWFELDEESPYMLLVADVVQGIRKGMTEEEQQLFGIAKLNVPRSSIPAVTHVDYSARVQTVSAETNKPFHDLLTKFNGLTGCPLVVNTSFNVRGEPIVSTPGDAYRCFMGTDLDVLVVGNCFLEKSKQPEKNRLDYKTAFEAD